jgi:hypothetical protein
MDFVILLQINFNFTGIWDVILHAGQKKLFKSEKQK